MVKRARSSPLRDTRVAHEAEVEGGEDAVGCAAEEAECGGEGAGEEGGVRGEVKVGEGVEG